jgi:integrase
MSTTALTTMRAKVEAYLKERRQSGFKLQTSGSQLKSFVRFAQAHSHRGPLTVELALAWAQASRRRKAQTAASRLAQLRPFAQFCHRIDPADKVPPAQFFGRSYSRSTPHVYTLGEIRSLIDAAARWSSSELRAASYATIFGLLAATGMRLSEVIGLQREDVDLKQGVLTIRETKFYASRYVPLHPSTVHALKCYIRRRDRDPLSAHAQRFFVAEHARVVTRDAVQYVFRQLRQRLKWRCRGTRRAPRIHDLRFAFICRRIERWYAQGVDVDQRMLALSTYVGHATASGTYWYLTATPRLMALAAGRFARRNSGGYR